MKKTLFLILIASATIGSMFALVYYVKIDQFSFAWALNFLLMFFVAFFTETLKSQLTSPYYDEKTWEKRGKVYENLGANLFKKLLVAVGWEKVIRKTFPIEKNTKSLERLYYQTKKSELDHLIIFIIVLGFNIVVAIEFGFFKSLPLLVLNLLLNLYPIFLQRYNRPRIAKALRLSLRKQTL